MSPEDRAEVVLLVARVVAVLLLLWVAGGAVFGWMEP